MSADPSAPFLAAAQIVKIAKANPNISVDSLQDELERGDIAGWEDVVNRYSLNFSQWSGAMERAIAILVAGQVGRALEDIYPLGYCSSDPAP